MMLREMSHDAPGVRRGPRAAGRAAPVCRSVDDDGVMREHLEVMRMSVPVGWKARGRPRRFDEEFFTFEIEIRLFGVCLGVHGHVFSSSHRHGPRE